MSNSTLVDYTRISPNRTSPRNHKMTRLQFIASSGNVPLKRWVTSSRLLRDRQVQTTA